jgi:hypothetical protein
MFKQLFSRGRLYSEDVVNGIACMSCLQLLVDDAGDLCDCGHPVFCRECWLALPERKNGAPYFDDKTGQLLTG